MKQKFKEGDKVFAKVRGYPYWPARVQGLVDDSSKPKYNVFFYGSGETAVIKNGDICDFVSNKLKYGKNKKSKIFVEAIAQIEAELGKSDLEKLETVENKPSSSKHEEQIENTSELSQNPNESLGSAKRARPSNSQKALRKQFKTESKLIDLTINLINCFKTTKQDLPLALKIMNEIFNLDLTSIMLLKLPTSFYAIRRIKKYKAIPEDKATPEAIELLDTKSEEVRDTASKVYNKFKSLFVDIPENKKFHEHFSLTYNLFKEKYKDLSPSQIVRITQF